MKNIALGIVVGTLFASCIRTYVVPLRDPVDSTRIRIVKIDTVTTEGEKFKEIYYKNKIRP